MKKLFIIHENDEWCDLSGMKAIADFLKSELEKLDWQIISQHISCLMVEYFMSNKFK